MIIERQQAGCKVRIDTEGQVLSLDASPWSVGQIPLVATMAAAIKPGAFVPAAAFALKAKLFEQGLFAAITQACQPSKLRLLEGLVQILAAQANPGADVAAGLLLAARRMSGRVELTVSPAADDRARKFANDFMADAERSEPSGFYAWNGQLAAIFRQDRLLDTPLTPAAGTALAHALQEVAPPLRATYDGALRLGGMLANMAAEDFVDLRRYGNGTPLPEAELRFMPPIRTIEGELSRKLFGDQSAPPGINMMDVVIQAFKSGQVRARPSQTTGWYEYQIGLMEALLRPEDCPEAKFVELTKDYRSTLELLFRATAPFSGDSHNLPSATAVIPTPWKPKIEIKPNLTLEPAFSYYYRRGVAYTYLQRLLESFFGSSLGGMRRLGPDGPVQETLTVELAKMESLFMGAAEVVAEELEMPLPARPNTEQDVFWVRHWMADLGLDPDLSVDHRSMVPLRYETKRRKVTALADLGFKIIPLSIGYARRPNVTVTERDGLPSKVEPEFRAAVYDVVCPIVVQVSVAKLLEPTELRAACDEAATEQEIIAKLSGY